MKRTNNSRKAIVVANWKMHGTCAAAIDLVGKILVGFASGVTNIPNQANQANQISKANVMDENVEIVICPPAILIPLVCEQVGTSSISNLLVGGQNCYSAAEGAYTGEISPNMLQDFSCQYVILGHSERRRLFAESDALIAKKFVAAQAAGLQPILCIGESQHERDSGNTLAVITAQLRAVLDLVGIAAFAQAVVAYEPVWAIGTGLTASPQQAQEVHNFIRNFLAQLDLVVASQVRIIYGGSVKAENAAELFSQLDIDGGLIGGAALKADEFVAICKYAAMA